MYTGNNVVWYTFMTEVVPHSFEELIYQALVAGTAYVPLSVLIGYYDVHKIWCILLGRKGIALASDIYYAEWFGTYQYRHTWTHFEVS